MTYKEIRKNKEINAYITFPVSLKSSTVNNRTQPMQYGITIHNSHGLAFPSGEWTFSMIYPIIISEIPSKILLTKSTVPTVAALMQATSV